MPEESGVSMDEKDDDEEGQALEIELLRGFSIQIFGLLENILFS